jgi:RNA polymerase sigma factor (sigma-70 family)
MADAEDLYRRFGASLYRYAAALLADRTAADDVIQQVFLAIVRRPDLYMRSEIHYLRRAVRNECYSETRRRARLPESSFLEPVDDRGGDRDERLALEQCLRELPVEQREVVYLHVFEGLTFQEVAARLGDSPNTIAARYRYGLEKVRKMMIGHRVPGESHGQ